MPKHKRGTLLCCVLGLNLSAFQFSYATEAKSQLDVQKQATAQDLQTLQARLYQKIDAWGKNLSKEDFERNWMGRQQLVKTKRVEVCGIYQSLINESYQLALNKHANTSADERLEQLDRKQFMQSLGYKNNVVDTQMGFNCRLR